jgi:hypothetical protein
MFAYSQATIIHYNISGESSPAQGSGIGPSLRLFTDRLPDIKYLALSTADGLELSGGKALYYMNVYILKHSVVKLSNRCCLMYIP